MRIGVLASGSGTILEAILKNEVENLFRQKLLIGDYAIVSGRYFEII